MHKENTAKINTVADILNWAVQRLESSDIFLGHGTDDVWDETVFLILYALNLPPDTDKLILKKELTSEEQQQITQLIERRVTEKIPAPYLMHEAWFAGLPFYVDERVLIPRSPLAELIENQFEPWILANQVHKILDIGTGSGCIAIACTYAFPEAQVDATDIDAAALEVAQINVAKHHCTERVRLMQSDVFANLVGMKYDVIISNPPYVAQQEMKTLPAEYNHEPASALVAGIDGLDIVERILQQACEHLNPHGILIVEVGNSAEALMEKFPTVPFVWLEFACGEAEVFLLTYEQLPKI